ncbi:MAG: HAD-IIB family hydrolase [Treponema sp.]|jgi:HAD superfamily hydrolase (TIGR01484 family)|nr:HAD-IIB family hydrolase [Treponema sp.]
MKNIAEMSAAEAAGVKYILMDIDDTITCEGKLLACSYDALWKLKEAGLKVIPVTGRPAGWCDLIAREWPVDGVVGENGALTFWEERTGAFPVLKAEYHPNAVRNDHPVLKKIRERALKEVPGLRDAKDQFARLFDIALDFAEEEPVLPLASAERVRDIAVEEGAMAKISSIHVNIWMGKYDKLSMAGRFLADRFGWRETGGEKEVVFVGDSPNDEPMFARFPLACAVANVEKYRDYIKQLPAFVASKECGDGFAEIAEIILARRSFSYKRGSTASFSRANTANTHSCRR